ncbi:MAG: PQQ-binding-like beta-propeller repeat protein [Planctomycetota bacterium]
MKRHLHILVLGLSAALAPGCLGQNHASPLPGSEAVKKVDQGLRGERPVIDEEKVKAFGFRTHWDSYIRDEAITSLNLEGDQLYAFTESKRLYQIDMHSGMVNWVYDVGKQLSFTEGNPIAEWNYEADKDTKYKAYDEIFFVAEDVLIGLDKKNGSELFTSHLTFSPSGPPRASASHVFIGSWDDRIYGIRKDYPGVPDWFWRTNGDVRTRPAYDSPTAFVCSRDGTMYTFDAATGRQKWDWKTDKQLTQDPLIFKSLLYLPSDDYNLYVLDVSDGLLHHRTCVGAPITSAPIAIDKTVYFAAGAQGICALLRKGRPEASQGNPRKTEHELIWQRKPATRVLCKGSQDVYLLEPAEGGGVSVARIDAKDGHFRDSLPLSGVDYWITNDLSPADPDQQRALRGGTIIIGFRSGWIVALKELATIPGA